MTHLSGPCRASCVNRTGASGSGPGVVRDCISNCQLSCHRLERASGVGVCLPAAFGPEDKGIERVVSELYGLIDDDIRIVEEATS